jgi:hypothetical protein
MKRLIPPAGQVMSPALSPATAPVPTLPVLTAEELDSLIRQLQAETFVEPSSHPLSSPRLQQVRFGLD